MVKAFISYSHLDEPYCKELEKHLSVLKRNGEIITWTDRKITAGEIWNKAISKNLLEADLILLLVSSDFISSDYCYDIEMKTAIQRHNDGKARVIPIIIRFCDWQNTPFSKFQALPIDAKPVKDWQDTDKAFLNIIDGIKGQINLLSKRSSINEEFKIGLSVNNQISDIRKRMLVSRNNEELRKLLFEINELKKTYSSYEIEELSRIIETSMKVQHIYVKVDRIEKGMAKKSYIIIIIILALSLIFYFIFK